MLQTIHEHIKGWIAGIIIALISASFVFWGIQYYLQSETNGSATLAKVNGKKITEKQLQQAARQLERQYTERTGSPPTETQSKALRQYALQQLIMNNALLQSAREAGFRISADQVNQFITSLPQLQVAGQFSQQRYQQLLYSNDLTSAQFFQQTSHALLLNQIQNGIEDSAFVLPNEVKRNYELLYQKRSFGYFIIPSSQLEKSVKITPKEIKNYYQKNKDKFKIPERVSIAYIVLSPKVIRSTMTVSAAEVKQYYQDNISNYRVPRRWKIERIFLPIPKKATTEQIKNVTDKMQALEKQLKKGVSFSRLMKQEDGVTQWVNEIKIPSKFAQYLSTMKPGDISPPFRTAQGMSLVRLLTARPATTRPFAEVKEKVKNRLIQKKVNRVMSKQSEQLSDITYTNPTTLQPAAKALKLKIQTTGLFSRDSKKTGILSNPNIVATAFSANVLQDGNNSNPITLKNGSLMVLRVKKHEPSQIPPLKNIVTQIKQRMTQRLAQAQAAILAEKIQTALNQGKSVKEISSQYHLVWKTKINVNRLDKKVSSAILTAAFNLDLKKGHAVTTAVLPNSDSAVVKLNAIKIVNYNKVSSKQRRALAQKIKQSLGQLDYQLYIKSIKKNADIKITNNN